MSCCRCWRGGIRGCGRTWRRWPRWRGRKRRGGRRNWRVAPQLLMPGRPVRGGGRAPGRARAGDRCDAVCAAGPGRPAAAAAPRGGAAGARPRTSPGQRRFGCWRWRDAPDRSASWPAGCAPSVRRASCASSLEQPVQDRVRRERSPRASWLFRGWWRRLTLGCDRGNGFDPEAW